MSIIVPEIYSQLVTEKVKGNIKISALATDLGELDQFSQEGDSITFPQFSALSDAELVVKGVAISTEELAQTSTKKLVKHYGKGVEIYDIEALTGKGNFLENGVSQQARIFARALDNEMVADIDANAILKKSVVGASAITEAELQGALQLFGDDQDNSTFAGIVINSLLLPSFYGMDGFVNSNITYSKEGNGQIENGVIGYYRGSIPVILSDVNTYDTVSNECKTYIIKKGSLGRKDKRGVLIEVARDASKKKNDVFADIMFAVGLIQNDGVVIVRKTIV